MQHNTDGGPAFGGKRTEKVLTDDGRSHDWIDVTYSGMSLRDYFASKALEGLIAKGMNDGKQWDNGYINGVAMIAYDYADAMLKARTAKSPSHVAAAHLATFGQGHGK